MKCYIIVILEDGDAILSTRKQFPTREAAEKHLEGYAECWRKVAIIVECPLGLTY
jgi:hypothetical protein